MFFLFFLIILIRNVKLNDIMKKINWMEKHLDLLSLGHANISLYSMV